MSQGDAPATSVLHGGSFDVEGYRQILRQRWRGHEGLVSEGYLRDRDALCALLNKTGIGATFFVTGTVAADRPEFLRRWQGPGHKVACHGWHQTPIWQMDPTQFRCDPEQAG